MNILIANYGLFFGFTSHVNSFFESLGVDKLEAPRLLV
jgi:hypothetical protein